jgi:Mn2+/Fe2+ NRAMP family transporter
MRGVRQSLMRRFGPKQSGRATDEAPVDLTPERERGLWRHYLRALGPGLVTGASDDDPSAIATYAAAGAQTGFAMLWTCVVSFPLMLAVQVNSDRAALATGKTFGELARLGFGSFARRAFMGLLVIHLLANVLVTSADLVAVGAGMSLLGLGPAWAWSLAAGAALIMLVTTGSFAVVARVLKVLCVSLLGYVAVVVVADVPWGEVARATFAPRLVWNETNVALLVAVFGATLPPYVFFWQNVHRVEELREEPQGGDKPVPLKRRGLRAANVKKRASIIDVVAGMAFAVLVMFSVMVSLAVTVAADGPKRITTAAQAAEALQPVAGDLARLLFAVGFVSAGLLAVPVLAGAAAANITGLLGRPWGFSRSLRDAPLFYGFVGAATVTGALLGLAGVEPIRLLVLAATANGITSAPLLVVVMVMSGDRVLMGDHRPGRVTRMLGWAAVAVMSAAALALLATAL